MSSVSSEEISPRRRIYRRNSTPGSDDELFDAARSLSSFRSTPRIVQTQRYASDRPQSAHHASSSYQNAGPASTSYQQAGPSSTSYQSAGAPSTSYPTGLTSASHQSSGRASASYQTTHPPSTPATQPAVPSSSDSRPQTGVAYSTPKTVQYSSAQPTQSTAQPTQRPTSYAEPQPEESSKKKSSSSKGKEKEKDRHKSSSSKKANDRDTGRAQNPRVATAASGAPPASHYPKPHPRIPGMQTAFRIDSYVNDPRAGPSPAPVARGPYSSDFRATLGPQSGTSASASTHRTSTHATAPVPPSSDGIARQEELKRSYYRHDYEKQRDPTQAHRREATGSTSSGRRESPAYAHPSSHHSSAPPPSAPAYPYAEHYSSAPPPSSSAYPYPEPNVANHSSGKAHAPPTNYRQSSPPREYERYEPPGFQNETYRAPSPVPPPSNKHSSPDRRHRSHSRRHEHEPYAHSSAPSYSRPSPPPPAAEVYDLRPEPTYASASPPPQPSPVSPQPIHYGAVKLGRAPAGARVLRILTLLIEDQRRFVGGDPVSMLVEVSVPLKPADDPNDGFWADAREVSDELQAGPSRIDGRAKVFTMRGRFRQYFLRITPEDGLECSSANLKATPERTMELFVEDLPSPTTGPPAQSQAQAYPYAPSQYERRPLTPAADSVAAPAPPWMAPSPPRQPSPVRHSHHSQAVVPASSQPRYSYESDPPPRKPRKRHRESTSARNSMVSYAPPPETSYGERAMLYEHPQPRYGSPSGYESGARMSSVAPTPPLSRYSPASYTRSPVPMMSPASVPAIHVMPPPGRYSPYPASPPQHPPPHVEYRGYHSDTTPLPGPPSPKKARHHRRAEPESSAAAATPSDYRRTPPAHGAAYSTSYPPAQQAPAPASDASYYPPRLAYPAPSAPAPLSYPPAQPPVRPPSAVVPASGPAPAQEPPAAAATTRGATPSNPQKDRPSAVLPSASGGPSRTPSAPATEYSEEVSMAVGMHLRGIFSRESGWDAFVKGRNSRIKMAQQLEQYRYVKSKFDEYVGSKTPADLAGAPGITITRVQVMKAFNLPVSWAEEAFEVLALTEMYGPGGKRSEDPRVGAMLDELPPTTTGIQLKKYLGLLREIHSRWSIEHPAP